MFSVTLLWLIFHRVPTLFCCKPYTRAMKRPASSSTSVQMKRPALCEMKRPSSSKTTCPVSCTKPMKPLHGTLKNCNVDNEEGVLTAKSEFHNLIQTEITKNECYICIGSKYFCRWCPFRYFQRAWRVRVHQLLYHKKDKRYTPSGTQQLTIASALYDHDIFSSGVPSGNYLQRSAAIMRTQVDPLGPNVNSIPRGLVKRAL